MWSGTLAAVSLLVCTLLAPPLEAAEPGEDAPREAERSAGIGIDVGMQLAPGLGGLGELGGLASLSPVRSGLRIPIELSTDWQLEPRLGFRYGRQEFDQSQGLTAGPDTGVRRSWSLAGSLSMRRAWAVADRTRAYAGVIAGGTYATSSTGSASGAGDVTPNTRGHSFFGGPVLGGEAFVSPALSVGLETALTVHVARSDLSPDDDSDGINRSVGLGQIGSLVFRLYL